MVPFGGPLRAAKAALLTCWIYLPAHLWGVQLRELIPRLFQDVYNDLAGAGKAPATVSLFHRTLRTRLTKAVQLGYLGQNPVARERVSPPRAARRDYRILSPTEAKTLLAEADGGRHGALWTLLLLTGLRPGEALGAKWEDLDGNQLRVQRALVRLQGGAWRLEETKTRRGRTVSLPQSALRALTRHRARQAECRLQLGTEYADRGFIFASELGAPLDWRTVAHRSFRPLMARVALRLVGADRHRPKEKDTSRPILSGPGMRIASAAGLPSSRPGSPGLGPTTSGTPQPRSCWRPANIQKSLVRCSATRKSP